jgi:hypothetical protein
MIKPLPKSLLIHEISYEEKAGNDGWDNSYLAPVTIEFVRVEPNKKVKRSGGTISEDANLIVFIDRTHSKPYPDFKGESRITFKGNTYELSEVFPVYDTSEIPHHYELGLK